MSVRQVLDELKFSLRIKTDEELAEMLNTSKAAIDKWITRKAIPEKWKRIIDLQFKYGNFDPAFLRDQDEIERSVFLSPFKTYDPELLRKQKELDKKGFANTNTKLDLDRLRAEKERVQGLKGNVPIRYFENVTASAGYGSNNSDESFEEFEVGADFLRTVLQVKPTKYGYDMIRVLGDSMEPFVQDGDIIVIDRHTDIKNGDVVIANLGQDTFTKKFLRDPLHNSIKLTSLSEYYQDIVLRGDEIEELRIVGKVVCKFSINMKVF